MLTAYGILHMVVRLALILTLLLHVQNDLDRSGRRLADSAAELTLLVTVVSNR